MTHIAYFQASLLRDELGTEKMEGFNELNSRVYSLAERCEGIEYIFKNEKTQNGLSYRLWLPEHPLIVSQVLVANSIQSLMEFAHSGEHREAMSVYGSKYFDIAGLQEILPLNKVFWQVKREEHPDLYEGKEKLEFLIENGPTEEIFGINDVRRSN